jgi:uncharacterized protein (TIGR02453 family)
VAGFEGFPEAALDFYEDLEMDNTRSFWTAHKEMYETSVRAPMVALLAELEPEFGTAKVYRPYRDVRYAKDKTPYKTHQGGFVACGESTGWYVQVDARGVFIGVGCYAMSREALGRMRDAIVDERRGRNLEALVAGLTDTGWTVTGDRLKTTPRGYDPQHPRIELLRYKAIHATRSYGFDPVIHTSELRDRIAEHWRAGQPLVAWLADNGVT